MNRILAWLNPFDYAQTTTYQQAQGQLAIASGGLFGQGFNVSPIYWFPYRESDMIFTVVAEDFGFVGALGAVDFICDPDLPNFKNHPPVQ